MNKFKHLIVDFHNLCHNANYSHKYKQNKKYLLWFLTNIGFRIARIILMAYLWFYKLVDKYPAPLDKCSDGIIVSLTSFPARISTVWMTVDSIMKQTCRPSKIILYLTEEEFPNGRKGLPNRLLNYEKLGLEIYFRPYNLMPHNKYFYALQEYSRNDVITIDDDIYYHPNTIENLVRLHCKHPICICANTIRIVGFHNSGESLPYEEWKEPTKPIEPSIGNVALGFSGVYYPAGVFKNQDVFDMKLMRELGARVDDLWLRAHETIEKIPVVNGEYCNNSLTIIGSQRIALNHDNCKKGKNNGNDVQWSKICEYYGLTKDDFVNKQFTGE